MCLKQVNQQVDQTQGDPILLKQEAHHRAQANQAILFQNKHHHLHQELQLILFKRAPIQEDNRLQIRLVKTPSQHSKNLKKSRNKDQVLSQRVPQITRKMMKRSQKLLPMFLVNRQLQMNKNLLKLNLKVKQMFLVKSQIRTLQHHQQLNRRPMKLKSCQRVKCKH